MIRALQEKDLIDRLPQVRGKLRAHADLAKTNWFGVGGPAEILFRPADSEDLSYFLKYKPSELSMTVLGVGSNVIIRDGGLDGVVIKLGGTFAECRVEGNLLHAGAGALDMQVASLAQQHGLGGLEFLSGIPGTIGGALRMNAGAYGREMKDVLVSAQALDSQGNLHELTAVDMKFSYRRCNGVPENWIFISATLRGTPGNSIEIAESMQKIAEARESTQPIKSRTGGSTFKNPEGHKAWTLIERAGCRGLSIGGAQISEKHCNFMINIGNGTAAELEALGEEVIRRVKEASGITLEWEIKRIGKELA